MEGNMKKQMTFIGVALVILLTGCNFPGRQPTSESACGDQELCEEFIAGEKVGSFTLRILRNLQFGPTFVLCDTYMTVWFNIDPEHPAFGYLTYHAIGDSICNSQLFGSGTGGSHTTTCDTPVSYIVDGNFRPSPDCYLTVEITETMELSEMNNCVNSVLGVIPIDPSTLPPDEITFFPKLTVRFPDMMDDFNVGNVISSVIVSDIVVDKDSGCLFGGE
jgi:hypothetical protein